MKRISLICAFLCLLTSTGLAVELRLANDAIAWQENSPSNSLSLAVLEDKLNGGKLNLTGECFQLELGDGTILKSSDFELIEPPKIERLKPEAHTPVAARHFAGKQIVAKFAAPARHLSAEWRVILRNGATYVRQELTLHAVTQDVLVKNIELFDQPVPDAKTVGSVDGSPVVAGNFFFSYEHPMAQNVVDAEGVVHCGLLRNADLKAGETLTQSCVLGVVPEGQLRRGFLAYVERERAHPYRPFLHYNSWYDIAWDNRKYDEAESLEAIRLIGNELVTKRGVKLDSYLFDDGWDDNQTLWKFHQGFPNGFAPLKKEAEKFHAGIGVWISPFGGYSQAKAQRLKYAAQFGFETNAAGFSLAGPKYFQRFNEICLQMMQQYGVNQFKFDGLAAGGKAAASGQTRDGDAMLRLIAGLRETKPDLYISQTVGTWPSPFWLLHVDSTWRGGSDHSFQGKGSWCQQWITYHDAQTFQRVVQAAPLYPLNSIMLHGIIYATNADHLQTMSDGDFRDQVRSFFGSGTQLQEMYISPHLFDQTNWNDLAEAARWSRSNAETLKDTHWIGGDPGKGEVYGWASWSPKKAVLVLRNPDEKAATFNGDVANLFELPEKSTKAFRLRSPWRSDRGQPSLALKAGASHTFNLEPFQVLVLESTL